MRSCFLLCALLAWGGSLYTWHGVQRELRLPLIAAPADFDAAEGELSLVAGYGTTLLRFEPGGAASAARQARTLRVSTFQDGKFEPEQDIQTLAGAWNLDEIYYTPDSRLLLMVLEEPKRRLLQVFRTVPFDHILDFTLPATEETASDPVLAAVWPYPAHHVSIDDDELYLRNGIP